jgi:D-glycero-D-manno-heptose 1,7-bisphosphate phosphatase
MKRRGLLLDRDGVINVDHGYVAKPEQFQFLPGLFPFLRAAQDMGFRLAILTNQSGVARGFYTAADYEKLMAWMRGKMAKQGISIDLALACFEHAEGTVPARSAFLGDHLRDMQAAKAGGIGLRLLLTDHAKEKPEGVTVVRNFEEALGALAS